jgi:hypothetical protein
MSKVSVLTLTLGRELYIRRLFESIDLLGGDFPDEHVIVFQGTPPSDELNVLFRGHPNHKNIHIEVLDTNVGIEVAMKKFVPQMEGDLIMKMDDDCIIRSPKFFNHAKDIHERFPNLFFSPYPVGLTGSPGGPSALNREVFYSDSFDVHYTFRVVSHIGGFARFAPAKYFKPICSDLIDSQTNDIKGEDVQVALFCTHNQIPMAYLENQLIVEHHETGLGQKQRYGDTYDNPH